MYSALVPDNQQIETQISTSFPLIIINQNEQIIYYNEAFLKMFREEYPFEGRVLTHILKRYTDDIKENSIIEHLGDEPFFGMLKLKTQDQPLTYLGIYITQMNTHHSNQPEYLAIFSKSTCAGYITRDEDRYLNHLKHINKISSQMTKFDEVQKLAQFIVDQLQNEKYNFFHVSLFLRTDSFQGNELQMIAVAGESQHYFKAKYKDGYKQSITRGVVGRVVQSGEPEVINDTSEINYYYSTPEFFAKSEICVPIILMNQVIGAINIESKEKANFDQADIAFLETVADMLAINIYRMATNEEIREKNRKLETYLIDLQDSKERLENQSYELITTLDKMEQAQALIEKQKQVLEKELKMAADLQKSLLPKVFPDIPYLHFSSKYIPTSHLGGDIFDVVQLDKEHIGLIVADVSGHGVSAAIIAAMFKAVFSNFQQKSLSTAETMSVMNDEFRQIISTGEFISAFYLILNTETMKAKYTNAAHSFPLWYQNSSGRVKELDTSGYFLGVFEKSNYEEKEILFEPGDKILLYTDGVVEAQNREGKEFGRSRLKQYFQNISKKEQNQDRIIENIYSEVIKFTSRDDFNDDLTLLLMEYIN